MIERVICGFVLPVESRGSTECDVPQRWNDVNLMKSKFLEALRQFAVFDARNFV